MADQIEIAERLKQARIAAGFKSARAAAEALGVPPATYTQHENGRRGLGREAELYVRRYKISLDWLMRGKGDGPTFGEAEPGKTDGSYRATIRRQLDIGNRDLGETETPIARPAPNASFPPIFQQFPDASIPLMGRTVGGPNGKFIMSDNQIGRVFCPPGLEGVEGAYALQVLGTSAYPRFKEGQTVWINPHAHYVKGDDVVVQVTTDDEEYPTESYIKEYVSRSGGTLRLWQHNPGPGEKNEIEFDLKNVYSVHKVVFAAMT